MNKIILTTEQVKTLQETGSVELRELVDRAVGTFQELPVDFSETFQTELAGNWILYTERT